MSSYCPERTDHRKAPKKAKAIVKLQAIRIMSTLIVQVRRMNVRKE